MLEQFTMSLPREMIMARATYWGKEGEGAGGWRGINLPSGVGFLAHGLQIRAYRGDGLCAALIIVNPETKIPRT
jgi:hypothetical protein